MSKQGKQELEFTRASLVGIEELTSLVLEARINGDEVANLAQLNGEWFVMLQTHRGIVWVSIDNIGKIIMEFAAFIQQHESFTPTGDSSDD